MEKLANFDRERIPERVVHARGASAKGFFEVTHDVSHLTCADFLRAPGVQTPVIVRFSTVIHERGSPETMRDPRGFAVKFYTREVDIYIYIAYFEVVLSFGDQTQLLYRFKIFFISFKEIPAVTDRC